MSSLHLSIDLANSDLNLGVHHPQALSLYKTLAGHEVTSTAATSFQAYNDAASSSTSAVATAVSSVCSGGDISSAVGTLAQAIAEATAKAVVFTATTINSHGGSQSPWSVN